MADFNEIRDYAEERGTYNFLSRFLRSGNVMNKLFWTALAAVIGIGLFIFIIHGALNQDSKLTWNKVKPGDRLYAYDGFFKDTILTEFTPFRLLKPIAASDIDTMKIQEWEKVKLKAQLDTSLKPQLVTAEITYKVDSLFKSKSSFVGIYVGKDSIHESGFIDHWYIFKPAFKKPSHYLLDIPKGYILSNDNYYMDASDARLEEAPQFKK
ncbi:hypothetical protein SAMN05216464_110212 [Mucilaginibacter pineti]|uniref:Uncharacterized protein n=1 Tax=Mucilaginibacter pineti TaxID=1391627 RepID=A0A1G7GMC0_9SPHI|nr:hypothetical protein [Mucilaginibacter pineti]SDE89285.1 hypothetical protein SAMN05216464_110212 [Mucilaginibacter pineti]